MHFKTWTAGLQPALHQVGISHPRGLVLRMSSVVDGSVPIGDLFGEDIQSCVHAEKRVGTPDLKRQQVQTAANMVRDSGG